MPTRVTPARCKALAWAGRSARPLRKVASSARKSTGRPAAPQTREAALSSASRSSSSASVEPGQGAGVGGDGLEAVGLGQLNDLGQVGLDADGAGVRSMVKLRFSGSGSGRGPG